MDLEGNFTWHYLAVQPSGCLLCYQIINIKAYITYSLYEKKGNYWWKDVAMLATLTTWFVIVWDFVIWNVLEENIFTLRDGCFRSAVLLIQMLCKHVDTKK